MYYVTNFLESLCPCAEPAKGGGMKQKVKGFFKNLMGGGAKMDKQKLAGLKIKTKKLKKALKTKKIVMYTHARTHTYTTQFVFVCVCLSVCLSVCGVWYPYIPMDFRIHG